MSWYAESSMASPERSYYDLLEECDFIEGSSQTSEMDDAPPPPLAWATIFAPAFLPDMPQFEKDWKVCRFPGGYATCEALMLEQFSGLYTNHILFTDNTKQGSSKRVLVYNTHAQSTTKIKLKDKCRGVGLGSGGHYLLCNQGAELPPCPDGPSAYLTRTGEEILLHDVEHDRTIKKAHLFSFRRWTSNALGFCILDDSGALLRWAFADKETPGMVFRLADRAPRHRTRCITTQDGTWNAIVAVNRERTYGLVHWCVYEPTLMCP